MGRTRFNVEAGGTLRTRDGQVLGKITAVTIELAPEVEEALGFASGAGAMGAAVPIPGQASLGGSKASPGGGAGEDGFGGDVQVAADPVVAVYLHHCETMGRRPRAVVPAEERRIIREALKVAGETNEITEPLALEECKLAITGCSKSDFHMGKADPSRYRGRRRAYNEISNILKGKRGVRTTLEQIRFFVDIARSSGDEVAVSSATGARLAAAKRDVLTAFEFPGDEMAQRRGEEARAWLVEQGWVIQPTPEGPRFHPPV